MDGKVIDTKIKKDDSGMPFLTARACYEAKIRHEAQITNNNMNMLVLMQMFGHKKPDTTRKYYFNIDMNKYKGRIIGTLDGLYDFHDKIPAAPGSKDYIETIDSKGRTTKWMKSPKE